VTAEQSELVDDQVRALVRSGGLDQTLFVEAGAGSGKTTLLVDRIVNLVLHADVELASIAAITFTEAAAAELQSRIRATFEREEVAAAQAGETERVVRCRSAIADSDLAAITTLHGFANRILSEYSVAIGLPPTIRVLDEVSSKLAQEDRWDRFVDRLYETKQHTELLQAASALGIPIEPHFRNQATMRVVADLFNQNWDRLPAVIAAEYPELGADFDFSLFDDLVAELAQWQHENILSDDKLAVHLRNLLPQMQAVANIQQPLRKMRALKQSAKWGPGNGGRGEAWHGAGTVSTIKELIKSIQASKDDVLAPIIDNVLTRLGQVVAGEMFDAAQARRSDGGLEFHDLLVLARDVLRRNTEARHALRDRFQYLLLDEFQDTDPIQIELAVLIATSVDEVDETPWDQLLVDPGRLFFVGDPKQSIYRFRRADIALFLDARDRFAGPQGSAQLQTNFRTVEPIVSWVNAFFDEQMAVEIPNEQPRYEPLTPHRHPEPEHAHLHRPVLLGGPHPDPKVRAPELRKEEADDVVGTIRAIIADPAKWPVFDEVTNKWRPAQIKDITVLLPTRTSLPFLRAALDEAQVHYRITTGTLVYDTQEVVDALAALRAIDDPGDEISLVAALRSPMYACSDVDLVTWHSSGGRWDVRAPVPDAIPANHPVAQAVTHLRSLWRDRWFLTPSSILERLLRERRASLLAFGDPRTTDVWRRLRFLVEQARAFEEATSGDLRAFTSWAELQGGSMARVHEPLLPETDEDAISIQTIHGSKGLEFPITILSGMTTQFRNRQMGVSVLWSGDDQPSISMKKGVETKDHAPRADLEASMDTHEKMRLAYVATTRARDHLIVSCHHKPGKTASKTYGGIFWEVFDDDVRRPLSRRFDYKEIVSVASVEPTRNTQLGLPLDDRDQWLEQRRALLAPFAAGRVLSATGVAQAALTQAAQLAQADEHDHSDSDERAPGMEPYLVEQLVDQDDDGADLPVDELIGRRRGRTGTAIGSAVHAVLQRVDLAEPIGVDELVSQQCEVEGISDRTRVVKRLVEAALDSTAVALAATTSHAKELFVTAPIEGRTIEGYVDLLIETDDGLIVIDYKTDSVRTESDVDAKLAGYELQAASYAMALEAVTDQPVIECRFVFCTSSGAIERTVRDLPAAKARVRSTVASLAASV